MRIAGFGTKEKVDYLLSQEQLDRDTRRQLHKFLEDVALSIQAANREVAHKIIPRLNREDFTKFAVRVAEARAQYVKTGFEVATKSDRTPADIARLKIARETNDEMLQAFEAAQRLIERGYVDLG